MSDGASSERNTVADDFANETNRPRAFYFEPADTPADSQLGIDPAIRESEELVTFADLDAFVAAVDEQRPLSVWINGYALSQFSGDWLGNLRSDGVVLVAINASVRQLAQAIGGGGSGTFADDWDPEGFHTFAGHYEAEFEVVNDDGSVSKISEGGTFNHYYDPQQPIVLFGFVYSTIEDAQGPNEPVTPVIDPNTTPEIVE
jgi:hypothetical protein